MKFWKSQSTDTQKTPLNLYKNHKEESQMIPLLSCDQSLTDCAQGKENKDLEIFCTVLNAIYHILNNGLKDQPNQQPV